MTHEKDRVCHRNCTTEKCQEVWSKDQIILHEDAIPVVVLYEDLVEKHAVMVGNLRSCEVEPPSSHDTRNLCADNKPILSRHYYEVRQAYPITIGHENITQLFWKSSSRVTVIEFNSKKKLKSGTYYLKLP